MKLVNNRLFNKILNMYMNYVPGLDSSLYVENTEIRTKSGEDSVVFFKNGRVLRVIIKCGGYTKVHSCSLPLTKQDISIMLDNYRDTHYSIVIKNNIPQKNTSGLWPRIKQNRH